MRKMKSSGVEWIGEIPEDWGIVKVKQAFVRKNEKAKQENPVILSLARTGVKVRDVSTNEGQVAESYYNYNPVSVGDLLLNPMDLYSGANCSLSEVEGVISPAYVNLKNKEGYFSKFYDYYFKVQYWMMVLFAHGKGVSFDNRWTLNHETLMNFPIVSPDFKTQKHIADFLDDTCGKIDRYIEKQQQIIDKLKEYKQAVITEAVTKGLNPDVPMKDSGIEWIGMIPEHWGVAKLANLFTFLGGYAFNSDLYVSETENLIVRIGNVKNDRLLFDANPVYISDDLAEQVIKFKLQCGDILFTMTGTKGKRDYFYTLILDNFHIQTKNLYLNQRVGCFRKKAHIHAEYYNYLLKDNRILDSIFLYETGTANQGNLGIDSINRTKVHLPPYDEQIMIANYLKEKCSRIDAVIAKKEVAINKSTEYKKSLIYEAVTGKLEV